MALKYWREILILALTVALVILGLYADGLRKDYKAEKLAKETAEANYSKCTADAKKSQEVSDEYQGNITKLRAQLNRLRTSSRCVPTESGSGHSGGATGGELLGSNGVRSEWLFEYAGRAEEVRLRLIGCQSFIKQVCQAPK